MKQTFCILLILLSTSCGVVRKARTHKLDVSEKVLHTDSIYNNMTVHEVEGDSVIDVPERYLISHFDTADANDSIETEFFKLNYHLQGNKIVFKTTLKPLQFKPRFKSTTTTKQRGEVRLEATEKTKATLTQKDVKKDFRFSNFLWMVIGIGLIIGIFIVIYYKFFKK